MRPGVRAAQNQSWLPPRRSASADSGQRSGLTRRVAPLAAPPLRSSRLVLGLSGTAVRVRRYSSRDVDEFVVPGNQKVMRDHELMAVDVASHRSRKLLERFPGELPSLYRLLYGEWFQIM
jgi:hypothetical protein